MRQNAGIGISLVLVLSLAVIAYAAYIIYSNQTAGGSAAGATGAGSYVLADIDDLAAKSDLVVMGQIQSSENITKMVTDTSRPAESQAEKYTLELNQITFRVDEYLKGSGGGTVTITVPADSDPSGSEFKLDAGTTYVVFLFDPNLLLTDDDFWAGTYLTQGRQGIWQVSGSDAERLEPRTVLTLQSLRTEIGKGSSR